MKKVMALVVEKMDRVLEEKVKLLLALEVSELEHRLDRKYQGN